VLVFAMLAACSSSHGGVDADLCPGLAGPHFDDDGDGIGDECDACPIAKPNATLDPDADLVDAPCDPDDHEPGDVIIAFSGFHDLPASWKPMDPAAWMIDNGALVVTPPDATTFETLTIPITRSSNHISLQTRWRVDSLISGATDVSVAVGAADRRPAGHATISCGTSRDLQGDHIRLDTDASSGIKAATNLFKTGGVYSEVALIDAATSACAIVGPNDNGAVQAAVSPDAMSEATLVVRGATVRFDYFLITARNPQGPQ
jgi:hypothetical protein